MSNLLKLMILSLTTIFFCSNAVADYDDYLSANGVKIELGQSQRYLESKLGVPSSETDTYTIWTLKNGNRLATSYDEYGLSNATISGHKPDFLYAYGKKIILGTDSINTVEKKLHFGCYYQGFGEGWISDYVVRSGPEGSWNLTFNSWGDDEDKLKSKKMNSISIGYEEPFGEQVYCKE